MAAIMMRVIKSFFLHLLILLAALGLVYLIVAGQESLSPELRLRYQGRPPAVLLGLVENARGTLMMWVFTCFLVSWLSSSLFLAMAERSRPANEREAANKKGLWAGMLVVTLAAIAFTAWLNLIEPGVSIALASGTFMTALLVGGILAVLAYYLATALAVKLVMRPSVPLATAMPSFWS
jgi:magnesium-transporting ATPase (P-type)